MTSQSTLPQQTISFVTAEDGARIAVAQMGTGPVIVKAANWLSHVSQDHESPVWNHWLREFSARHQLVRYDLRGCGLSDRDVDDISFDAWLSDLEAVGETLDEPFTLLGMSQGGALSIAYALRHPEKVERLILIGCYAQGMLARDAGEKTRLEAETLANLVQLGWGKDVPAYNQVFTNLLIPGGTPEQHAWWQRLERDTSTAEMANRTLEVLHQIDVVSAASKLDVPTLIFHGRDDARIPFNEGRKLAAIIPGAQFVPLDSANHVLLDHEPAWDVFRSTVKDFLSQTSADPHISKDFSLTEAETAVVGLIIKGLGNAEIADALGKTEKTVRNQVTAAFHKMDVRTRSELIVKVLSPSQGQLS